jgi:hypothetical protein
MYHVVSRGDQRDDLFLDDEDRYDFLKTPSEPCKKTDWQIHAFWTFLRSDPVDAVDESDHILWSMGPDGPWPPLDLIGVAIDTINEHLHDPERVGDDARRLAKLANENLPAVNVVGSLRKDTGVPTRWCIW